MLWVAKSLDRAVVGTFGGALEARQIDASDGKLSPHVFLLHPIES